MVLHQGESGLAGNQVNDIAQDSSGVLWIATNNGVSAFDGITFKNYTTKSGLTESLCTSVFIAKDGSVWIGHQTRGLTVLVGDSTMVYTEEHGLTNNEVHDIIQTKDGKIWVATFGGISVFDGKNWESITTENGLSFNNTQALAQYEDGAVWAGSYGAGVNIISDDEITQLQLEDGLANNYVTSLNSANGHMYVGTLGGVSDWNRTEFTGRFSERDLLSNQVNELALDQSGRLWLATFNGTVRMDTRDELMISEENGLPENEVLDVFIDMDDNVWLGSKMGLIRVKNLAFSQFESTEDFDIYPTCIFTDSQKNIWAGNETGGVLKYDGELFVQAFEDPDVNDHNISAITEDAEGNLWFGTSDFGGLFQFDGERFFIYSDEFGLADNNINCLTTTEDGLLFIGTPNGLSTFDGNSFEVVYISDDFATNHITALEVLADGSVLIGSKDGTVNKYLDGEVSKLENIQAQSQITDINQSSLGLCITSLEDGLWLLTDENVLHLNENVGISSKTKFCFESGRRLYVGSGSSFYEIKPRNDTVAVTASGSGQGYLGGAFKSAAVAGHNATYFIGTEKGITAFRPREMHTNNLPPLTQLTQLQLSYQTVNWKEKGFKLKPNGLPADLVLPYTENYLRFFFRGVDHRNPEAVRYKWKLEGHEKDWTPLTNEFKANYTGLPAGDYTFQVVACNENGICNPKAETFSFTIRPPFWKALWFHISVATVIVLLTYLIIRRRERVLRQEKEVLEATVTERTKELREQKDIVERQNAHITESIEYASNIQKAILPSVNEMQRAFSDQFVMYRPKDTVGGDFYWVYSHGDVSWAAAVDCTGHGVAGAFMSMIGSDLLNQIIIEKHISDPAQVLDELDKGIKLAFAQSEKEFETDQGMDVSLIRVDKSKSLLEFAGAQRPLFLIENGELKEIEGDKTSISCAEQMNAEPFTKHSIQYKSGSIAYLFSDGIVDQFGGDKGKKFMLRRLRAFIMENHESSLAEQADRLNRTFDNWRGTEHEQLDDVMLLAVQL
jgi:ligand-binding sensor domain-containing protein/serine phosphatase RsbU (regulator of sigma subunit)